MPSKKEPVTVLLVEDSPSDAQLLGESLRDYPLQTFVVERAGRLDEAVRLLTGRTFDVVLLDLNLPDSTGLATWERVRAAAPHTPVVVLTGADDEKVALEALRRGTQDYLVKGQLRGRPLGRAIHYAVERQQTENALREAQERLQSQAVELRAANEELHAQAGELQAANEELHDNEEALRRLNSELEQRVAAQTQEIRRAYGRLHDVLEMGIDITERQKAFQELEHRARQLQKLTLELSQAEDRERKRLAEILHDDLQQQLAATRFHLGILSNHVRKDVKLQEITARLNDMLKEAIEKSRSLSHELSPAVLYQNDLGATLEWLGRQVQAKHGLKVHVEVRGPIAAPSDALKAFLYKAAQEILFNVVKHAQTQEATVRLQRMHDELWLTISDRGRGFDPRTLSKTSGLGLLSIRERVELLGGRMKIKSAQSRGSTFLIAVPHAEMTAMMETETSAAGAVRAEPLLGRRQPVESADDHRLRVLLVDDHEVMREGLAALLNEQPDLEIVGQAGNGREAVDLAYKLEPDVIIMDAAMPVMPGEEATRQIRHHLPQTRVVALSMFHEAAMADKMRRAGAAAYLLKTAPSEELLAAIRARV